MESPTSNHSRRTITFIIAPGISIPEINKLRKQFDRPANKILVKNYDVMVTTVSVPRGHRLLVVAPGVPPQETKTLKKHIKRAMKDPSYRIVANYDLVVSVLPKKRQAA